MPETLDSFGRLRTSSPVNIFDTKQLGDNQALIWDDQEESGADTTSTHSVNTASTVLAVANETAGKRTRQTFMHHNYQPGKSQQILMTGTLALSNAGDGITTAFGYFNDLNGIFLRCVDGVTQVVYRSNVTGTPVDTTVNQTDWNIDKFNGKGPSTRLLDITKSQILIIDFEWLGVGRIRIGFIIDGQIFYAHQFRSGNNIEGVYMSTPNLPIRYQIENDGTGPAASMRQICATVISEGGADSQGNLYYTSTAGTHVDANVANTIYAVIGLKLKATHLGCTIDLENISMISETNDDFEWLLIFNPTVAGTFTYANISNSCLQTAKGVTANTVTNGNTIDGGFSKVDSNLTVIVKNATHLGSAIDGTPDTVVLCVRPLSINADIQAGITWREHS